jgi:uroporphyrinogen decarboxylase
LRRDFSINYEGLLKNLRREGTPDRVYFLELFLDPEIKQQIDARFDLGKGLDPNDPHYADRLEIERQRFLGYDLVRVAVEGVWLKRPTTGARDTTVEAGQNKATREWLIEGKGPIQTWEDFEKFPFPTQKDMSTERLEWFEKNLPDDMCIESKCHHILEYVMWLMGYEGLCYAMVDQPDLVDALCTKVGEWNHWVAKTLAGFDRVKIFMGGDDMGYKTGPMVSPSFLREKILPWHQKNARVAHEHGKLYVLHSCGDIRSIMEDLIEDVKIDARHSFEDVIEPVIEAKKRYGHRVAILGGVDVDFLCRASEEKIRARVREILTACHPGGGYCLGTGNSVANYIPVDNYLIMLDEGRRF